MCIAWNQHIVQAQVWECGDPEQCRRMGMQFWNRGAGLVMLGGPDDAASLQRWHERLLAWMADSTPPFPPLAVLWRTSSAKATPEADLSLAAKAREPLRGFLIAACVLEPPDAID